MRCVARVEEKRVGWGYLTEDNFEELDVDWRIILK
jgi:hypothetical protein